jgi:tetratricopeptide (TPR) repeat protein
MTNYSKRRIVLRFPRLLLSISIAFFLVACGGDEELERKKALYEAYTITDLQNFVDQGEYGQALEALHYYRDEGVLTVEHRYLLAHIYIVFGDGIASEVEIERLSGRGEPQEKTALMLAQSYMLQNRARDAEATLADIQLPSDQLFDALLLRGDIARSLEELGKANQFYMAAIENNSEDFRGHAALALLELQQGDMEKAEEFSAKAAERVADDSVVKYVQGMVARYKGQLEEAQTFFEAALALNDNNVLARIEVIAVYLAQNNLSAAEKEIDIVYSRTPNNPMANYYTALILVNQGKFDEAEDLLLRSGDFTQFYPPAAQIYGMATYELKKYATAIPYLRRGLRFYPNDVNMRLALADSLTRRGELAMALSVLDPFVQNGDNVDGLIQASVATGGLGDMRTARRYIEQALALAVESEDTDEEALKSLRRRVAFARFLDKDTEAASQMLLQMHQDDPDDVETLLNRSNMLLSIGDLSGAEEVMSKIIAIDPKKAAANNLLGAIRHKQRRYQEAVTAYSQAIDKVPNYQSALKNRAMSYIALADFGNARKDLEKLAKLAPNEAQVAALLGRALLETGDAEAAVPYLEQASEAMPGAALVAADHAEAVASLGYYSSAINLARKAKTLAPDRTDFVEYLNEQITLWSTGLANQKAETEAERTKQLEIAEKAIAKEREMLDAISTNSASSDEAGISEGELLAELKSIAEERRKAEQIRLENESSKAETELDTVLIAKTSDELKEEAFRLERNTRFGQWLAEEMQLPEAETPSYIEDILAADTGEAGNSDIIRKALNDIEAAGLQMTTQALEKKLREFSTAKAEDQPQD